MKYLLIILLFTSCIVYDCKDFQEANDPRIVREYIEAYYANIVPGSAIAEIDEFIYLIVTPEGESWIIRCNDVMSKKPTSEEKLKFKQL